MSTLSTSEDRLSEIRFIVESLILADERNANSATEIMVPGSQRQNAIYDFCELNVASFPGEPSDGSNFTRSSFENAKFNGTLVDILIFTNSNFSMSNLSKLTATHTNFDLNYFTLSKIVNANFSNCSFKKVNFRNCDLRYSKFDTCDFENLLNLETCDCRGTDFTDCTNFPFASKVEFITKLGLFGGKADKDTKWIDGTNLL